MKCRHCKGTGAIISQRGISPLIDHRRDYDDEQPCPYCDGTGEASTTPHEIAEQPAKCGGCQRALAAGSTIWRWWGQVFCSLRCCSDAKTAHDTLYRRNDV